VQAGTVLQRHCERSEAIQLLRSDDESWIASAFALQRFGGLEPRRSLRSKRRRVVASAPLRKRFAFVAGNDGF
jgi:hypothetical protein